MPFSAHTIYFVANDELREELEKDPVLNYNLFWIKPGSLGDVKLPKQGLLAVRDIRDPRNIHGPYSIPWDAIWSKQRYKLKFPKKCRRHATPPKRMLERIYELVSSCKTKAFFFSIEMHGGTTEWEQSWIFDKDHIALLDNGNKEDRKAYINAEEVCLPGDFLYLSLKQIGIKVPKWGHFEPHTGEFNWRAISLSPEIQREPKLPEFPSSLHRSAALGDLDAVQKCMEAGISPLKYDDILEVACASGNAQLVEMLIQHKVKVKSTDKAYFWASTLNHAKNIETIDILIKHGADVNHPSNPLASIAETGQVDAVEYLLKKGAKIVLNESKDLWFAACKGGILSLVEELYPKAYPEPPHCEGKGIRLAAENKRFELVKWLVSKGVEVDPETLNAACGAGSIEIVQWLLTNTSLDLNAMSEYGRSALTEAIRERQLEMVMYLLSQGADLHQASGYYGFSAIHDACFTGDVSIVKVLLDAGASIDCLAKDKRTPLFIAADTENQALVDFLLERGARIPDWKIEHYRTIQEVAEKKNISIDK